MGATATTSSGRRMAASSAAGGGHGNFATSGSLAGSDCSDRHGEVACQRNDRCRIPAAGEPVAGRHRLAPDPQLWRRGEEEARDRDRMHLTGQHPQNPLDARKWMSVHAELPRGKSPAVGAAYAEQLTGTQPVAHPGGVDAELTRDLG